MARGKFIVLEGLDRSGKSTQVEKLVKKLDARLQKFPGEYSTFRGSARHMQAASPGIWRFERTTG